MRWADEIYVKVYTRDTAEWLALGWEAQSLLLAILRKADRAGIVSLGRTGERGIAGLTGFPGEVVSRALPVLLDDGCLEQTPDALVVRNFLAAQETPASDRARKQAQRERDRDVARQPRSAAVELPPAPASPVEQAAPPSPASASAAAPPVAVEVAPPPAEPPPSAESTGPRDLFGEPVKAAPKRAAVKVEDPADVVFAAWLEGRALARVKSSHAPVLPAGDKRRAAVARIMSPKGGSFTLPQLQQAARGIWLNPWVLEDPSTRAAFGLVVRDAAHVENYLALAEAASTPAATPGYERRVVAPPPPRSPSPPPSASPPRPFAAPPVRTFAPPPSKSLPESA